VGSFEPLQLLARGSPAGCIAGFEGEVLSYKWSLECVGSDVLGIAGPSDPLCAGAPALASLAPNNTAPTLYLPPGSLRAGGIYKLICTVGQRNLLNSESYVIVRVRVSPLVAVISGAAAQAPAGRDLYLSSLRSFDPDAATTGIGLPPFYTEGIRLRRYLLYSWSCERLPSCSGPSCAASQTGPGPCPEGLFGMARESPFYQEVSYRTDDVEVGLNGTFLRAGNSYRVSLNVSRQLLRLPVILQNNPAFSVVSSASVDFEVVACSPVNVTIEMCDGACGGLGSRTRTLGTNARLVLSATAVPTSPKTTTVVDTVEWSLVSPDNDVGLLTPAAVMTSVSGLLLVLKAGTIPVGHTVRLRCSVLDTDLNVGEAYISVSGAYPPLGGTLTVSPSAGSAMDTVFRLAADAWTVDADRLPLIYAFSFAHTRGAYTTPLVVSRGSGLQVDTALPAGTAAGILAWLSVTVHDTLGSSFSRRRAARVSPGPVGAASALEKLSAYVANQSTTFFRSGDMVRVQGVLALAASMLSLPLDPCSSLVAGAEAPACHDEVTARETFRMRLLVLLESSRPSQVPSVEGILGRMAALHVITEAPLELNFEGANESTLSFDAAFTEIRNFWSLSFDALTNAAVFTNVHDNCSTPCPSWPPPQAITCSGPARASSPR
jgi:hypothetical protein